MDPSRSQPLLSIVVPVLNEAETLPQLLEMIKRQRDVNLEVILSDGGSSDDSRHLAEGFLRDSELDLRWVCGPCGRARQLNAGAAVARGEWILFLHADSVFKDDLILHRAVQAMQGTRRLLGHDRAAGHFPLRFARTKPEQPSFGYYFFEAKTSLNRPGCIHGDQGFLMTGRFFHELGGFDETCVVLEDDRLAEEIRHRGDWVLLPGQIHTSARRFESEGLKARQTLNALIMNFSAIGWNTFFPHARGLYRLQQQAEALSLLPFLRLVQRLLSPLPIGERLSLWYKTGSYVRAQGWQLAFALDCLGGFRRGLKPPEVPSRWLKFWDQWLNPLTDSFVGRSLVTLLVRCWFEWNLFYLQRNERAL